MRHRKRFEHGKVLMHHGNTQTVGFRRAADLRRTSVKLDETLVRRDRTEDDFHEGGLAGAVFAKNSKHFPGTHFQADVVVGDDARICFCDVIEPKSRGHCRASENAKIFGICSIVQPKS